MNFLNIQELGFTLDISELGATNEPFFSGLKPRLARALNNMKELESGSLANPDEKRMVGHYWLRASELAPNAEIAAEIRAEISKSKDFAKSCSFKNVLCIGIGGSALGPQFLEDALANKNSKKSLFFIDNTDPDGIAKILARVPNLKDCLVIVSSKSGNTKETRNAYLEVKEHFKKNNLEVAKQSLAITVSGSTLDQQAKAEGWLDSFYIWDFIGGRTSITSCLGLLPLALLGADIDSFLAGASLMDQQTRKTTLEENPALLLAVSWAYASEYGKKSMVVLPYADRLAYLGRYLQQLVMESLGKEKDLDGKVINSGLTVYGNKGSTDQHAYIQQLREGPDNFFVNFIEVLKDCSSCEVEPGITSADYLFGFLEGTKKALREKSRKSLTITISEINEKTLGALIALYERTVGFYASLINVNAYNQPGVEAGKKAATEILELQLKIKALIKEKPALAKDEKEIAGMLSSEENLVRRILRRVCY